MVNNNVSRTSCQLVGKTNKNAYVTCFYWSDDEKSLYFGDSLGCVTMINVNQFFARTVVHISVYPILSLDTEIVQIDGFDLLLLVSTKTKTILCNTEREEFKQIGNRSRDGRFGACFLNKSIDEYLRGYVYCARPGSRFWEVDFGGVVKQTIQYKDILATPPVDWEKKPSDLEEKPKKYPPQALQFGKLIPCSKFLLAFTNSGIYIFDPMNSNLVLWAEVKGLVDVAVVNNSIYYTSKPTDNSNLVLRKIDLKHKLELFEDILSSGHFSTLEDYVLKNKSFMKSKQLKLKARLKMRMEEFKETLIKNRQYECLEIISEVQYKKDDESDLMEAKVEVLSNRKETLDRNLRGVLSTVLRNKLGSFNLFSQPTKSTDLIKATQFTNDNSKLTEQRIEPFKEISSFSGVVDVSDVVVEKRKFFTNKKLKRISDMLKINENDSESGKEDKLIKNLFLIFKSAKIGNVTLVERYGPILDKYNTRECLGLMKKLEALMGENEYSDVEAIQNSTWLLFNYLKPEIIYEVDNETLENLADRFVLTNKGAESVEFCASCQFPLQTQDSCDFKEFGTALLELFLMRQDSDSCHKIIKAAPNLLNVFIKHWRNEGDEIEGRERFLQLIFILGIVHTKRFDNGDWTLLFKMMNELHTAGRIRCFFCNTWNELVTPEALQRGYSWNEFLNQAARFMKGGILLKEVLKYSKTIRNGDISKEFYLKCLQTA